MNEKMKAAYVWGPKCLVMTVSKFDKHCKPNDAKTMGAYVWHIKCSKNGGKTAQKLGQKYKPKIFWLWLRSKKSVKMAAKVGQNLAKIQAHWSLHD